MSVYTSIILTKFDQPLTVIFLTQFKAVEILKKSFLASDSNSRCVCFITRCENEKFTTKNQVQVTEEVTMFCKICTIRQ